MPRSPSLPDPPPGHMRAAAKRPYPSPLPYDPHSPYTNPHVSPVSPQRYPQGNPHPPAYHRQFSHDPYHRHPHGGDLYYHPYGGYVPQFHKPDFHQPHHLRPLPHPPAPPAPPRPQRPRQAQPQTSRAPHGVRSPLRPASSYYRSQAESNSQHLPPRPTPSWDGTQTSQSQETEACSSHSHPEGEPSTRSQSVGSRCDSEVQERTPSPVDPDGIRRWEELHSQPLPPQTSPGGGSSREGGMVTDGGVESLIDPSLRNPSRSSRSSLSHEFDTHDSAADDMSSHDSRAGDVNGTTTEGAGMPNPHQRPNSEYYPSPHHQAQFVALAKETGSMQRGNIGLNSLADGNPKERPSYPIPTVIKCAILGSPYERLTLSELYTAMEERFPFYKRHDKKSWRNSVRHNLSLNNQFEKETRPMTEPGKGHYWVVVPDKPQGNKRQRKRNKKPGKRALAAMAAEQARLALLKERESSMADISTDSNTSGISTDSTKDTDGEIPIDPRLTGRSSSYSASRHISGTLPANAGSYAAVTGAIPPPALDRHLFRPWRGDERSLTSTRNVSSQSAVSASTAQQDLASIQEVVTSNGTEELPLESSKILGTPGSVASTPDVPSQQPMKVTSPPPPAHEENSTSGVVRTPKTRVDRRYNPMTAGSSPSTPQRRSAFETLSAALEREGIGAKGSGGPASRVRKRPGSNGRAIDGDESESDGDLSGDPSGDEDYSPRKRRR